MKCSKCKHYRWVADSPENVTYLCLRRGRKMENADGICELYEDPSAHSEEFKAEEVAELRETVQSALAEIEASLDVIRECMLKLGK